MSDYPRSRHEMKRTGYTFIRAKACGKCGVPVETWKTAEGKFINMDAPKSESDMETVEPHFYSCKPKPAAAVTAPAQQSLWMGTLPQRQEAVSRLADACRARAVVVLQDDAMVFSCRHGIDPEDIRHELITAANQIRRDVEALHEEG